jgi:signal transduction histidine kinase
MSAGAVLHRLRRGARPRHLRDRIVDPRFWIVQASVVAVTVLHFLMERAEDNGSLDGFWDGFHHFPVEAFVVPVIAAGLWYGIEGGVMTGIYVTLLSVPNLVIFHREDYSWLGEVMSNAFVVVVGVVVAWFVDRERQSRRIAEETSRYLEVRNQVTAAIAGGGDANALVRSTLWALTSMPTVGAASFTPAPGAHGPAPVVAGEPERTTELAAAFEVAAGVHPDRLAGTEGAVHVLPVSAGGSKLGRLAVACGNGAPSELDVALFRTVARDLAVGLETLRLQDVERTDLQRYAQAVTVAQENERKRLARELHDGPAQSLIVLSRSLGRMASDHTLPDAAAAQVADMQEVTRHTLDSIRRTSRALRPALLDDLGLVPAVEALVDRHGQLVPGRVTFEVQGEARRLPPDAELAAFRIVQEALANVRRHADAEATVVVLDFRDDAVRVKVADDGRGFDKRKLEGWGSLGVTGMRERAELIGAKLRVRTAPAAGTTVRLKIPR